MLPNMEENDPELCVAVLCIFTLTQMHPLYANAQNMESEWGQN